MDRPYLSIVMTSRNDNHGGDLNERTQACIDSISNQIERFNLSAEIVMVDWNPPKDKPLLREIIDHSRCPFRSIVVPEEFHRRYGQCDLFPIYQMIAKNVGIRRALGRFIVATNVDIFFSDEIIQEISKCNLRKNILYRVFRYDSKPGLRTLKDVKSNLIRINLSNKDELCTNACGDFQLMHRDNWNELRGYYEADLFSIHIDSLFEYHAVCNGFREYIFSPPKVIYHVEHTGGWIPGIEESKEYNRMNDTKINKLSYEQFLSIVSMMEKKIPPFHYNGPGWGFGGEEFEEFANEKIDKFRSTAKSM